jgi:hypothetical protein
MILPERTTFTTIAFLHPFSLTDVDGVQPAGTYTVETIDRTLDNLSFIAYRRVSTAIMLPAVGASARQDKPFSSIRWNSRPLSNRMPRIGSNRGNLRLARAFPLNKLI